ncbi:unnamed protein product [Arctia plantaginis]|uniref:Uncharacterized protein n=1 Tax=Arctia plantaginis TaxID=874455 RepID=A0A8S0Z0Y2_ARCPL|nr:unnamed protein product [Arctia plantaginis]
MATQTAKPLSPVEEHGTKFRSSENFKHMKKYLKWKFENSTVNDSPQSTTPISSPCNEVKVKPLTQVQPPLPPYSPPPGVYIKKEIITTDNQYQEPEPCSDYSQPVFNTSIAGTKETMCRNFVRGTCKNEHTFFEQEQFYRTGELPAHATDHIKQRQQWFQRPFQPEVPFNASPQIVPQLSINTPFQTSSTMVPIASTPPTTDRKNSMDYGQGYAQGVYQYEPACSNANNKRPWTCDTYSQRDLDFREPPLKKCKDCDANEFRMEFYKNKAKEMIVAADDREQKLAQLRKKTQRLMAILEFVGQPVGNLRDINL